MFQTHGSAGYLGSLPPRLDRASPRSISTAAIDCVGNTADHRLSARGRACADAQGRCDGDWLQRNRLIPPSRTHHRCGRVLVFISSPALQKKPCISLVKSPEREALGFKTRRPPGRLCRALRIRSSWLGYQSCLYERVSYSFRQTLHQPQVISSRHGT